MRSSKHIGNSNIYTFGRTSLLEMDTAQLSKIEIGLRQLKREQIPLIAEILKSVVMN